MGGTSHYIELGWNIFRGQSRKILLMAGTYPTSVKYCYLSVKVFHAFLKAYTYVLERLYYGCDFGSQIVFTNHLTLGKLINFILSLFPCN